MNGFEFITAQRIVFGNGRFKEIGALAAELGSRVCLVTGNASLEESGRLGELVAQFGEAGLEHVQVRFGDEPTTEAIDEATAVAREHQSDVVVAVGGGSVLDAAKAIAALIANGGEVLDYIEGVGRGKALEKPAVPTIAAPTTSGTGSEAAKNSVIRDEASTYKKSVRSNGMLPAVALVDPELTNDCPPDVTAASGMDAFSQLLEAYVSRKGNPVTCALAEVGLQHAARLPLLFRDPEANRFIREDMALASLLGGICLANAGLGAVHALASPLGAFYPIPHGVVCAALLPPVVRFNSEKAMAENNEKVLVAYHHALMWLWSALGWDKELNKTILDIKGIDRMIADHHLDCAQHLGGALAAMSRVMNIPGLGHYGVEKGDFDRIIADAGAGNLSTNPVDITHDDLARILEEAL